MRNTVVILANSIKHNQHCVAGKCVVTKKWIRPVSNVEGKELSDSQATYTNKYGRYIVKPLQKIEMEFLKSVPLIQQPENHLITDKKWSQRYKIEHHELEHYLDYPSSLWGTGSRVLYNSVKNRTVPIDSSLYLVKVNSLRIYKNSYDKRRAKFVYNDINYDLPVTDPQFDKIMESGENLSGILCISLGECFNDNCYKIVATIF